MKLKRILQIIILLGIWSFQTYPQNLSPVVENVIFSQRTDGSFIVDVNYDVYDPENDAMTVSMQVSNDDGVTWDFSCNNITGDVGANINSGVQKHIEWDFGSEHSQTFGDQFRIKIIAYDGTVIMNIPCPGMPTITDPRDGKTYNTVLIGEQCWLKENMDIGTMIEGSQFQNDNGVLEKYCYDNLEANCTTYGGLYQWNEAMQYVTNEGAKGICPTGWHIPTEVEFFTLAEIVNLDGNSLKAIGQGTGSNTSGFSGMLAGHGNVATTFMNLGLFAVFWNSTENYVGEAGFFGLDCCDAYILQGNTTTTVEPSFSVRCLKNN